MPIARDDLYRCAAGALCMPPVSVLANDSSRSDGSLSVVRVDEPPSPGGVAVIDSMGFLVFEPPP